MKNIVAKGTIYLMIAQFFTSVFGYLIHIGLARFMGPASYGTFGVILSIFLITKTIFLTGTNRAISKYVAEKKYSAYSVLKTGAKLQFLLVGVALLFYIFFSESLAEFFNDPSLATPLLISSFILLPLALYILLSKGLLNGLRIFPVQAYLESSHSFVKLCVSFLLVYLGYGVFGALIGYIIGPLVAFVLGLYYIQKKKLIKKDSTNFSYKKLIHFALPITLFYMMATSTMEIGVLMLKFFHGSNVLVGYYTSATTLGKMSFSLFSALPFTMLPSISYAASNNNLQLIQRYIQKSLRYSLLLLFPFAVLMSTHALQIITFLYSEAFQPAAIALPYLAFGFTFFAIFSTLCSYLSGSGYPSSAMVISLISFASAFIFGIILIPIKSLEGAALTLLLSSVVALVISLYYVFRKFGVLLPWRSFFRISFVSGIIYVISFFYPLVFGNFIFSIIFYAILYCFLIYLFGEFSKEDVNLIRSLLRRK